MDTEALGKKALTDALRKSAGMSSSHVTQLVNGTKSPRLDTALMIEETTGIPPSFWINHKLDRAAAMWARIQEEMGK